MTIIGAKEFRLNMDSILDRVAEGEEIVIKHRFKPPVKLVAAEPASNPNRGDKVAARLDKLMEELPDSISPMLRDPNKDYKQLRDEMYRRHPKYRKYLQS